MKTKTRPRAAAPPPRNWVAKHARQVCKPATHRDKKNDYQRTPKHRHRAFGVFCACHSGVGPAALPMA